LRCAFVMGKFFWKRGDGQIIDGFGPNGVAAVSLGVARLMSILQTGYIYHYAFAMLVGVVMLGLWLLVTMGWKFLS